MPPAEFFDEAYDLRRRRVRRQAQFTWHVLFSTGDADDCVEDVKLASAPPDAVVKVNPGFKIRDADS